MTTASYVQATEWYEGGNLHDKIVSEWCLASYDNKLATAGDWIANAFKHEYLSPQIMEAIQDAGTDGIKMMAEELVKGMDKGGCIGKKAIKSTKKLKNSYVSALLMAAMHWLK